MKTLLKLTLVVCVTAVSLHLSITAIQTHLLEASAQEKTLSDLLLQQQMQQQLAAAAAVVEAEMEANNLVIAQAEVELKESTITPVEPTPEPEVEAPDEAESTTTQTQTTTGVTYTTAPDLEDIDDVEAYLIAHYFLNGYDYAAAETDPTLKAEKELACAMEAYVIDTIETLTGLTDVLSSFDLVKTQAIDSDMQDLQEQFQDSYDYLDDDPTFGPIYQAIDDYFDQALVLTGACVTMLRDFQASTNALLAMTTLMSQVDSVLMPQIDVVLDAVFTMKELTNAVYLQNTDATMLGKDDARALVSELETVLLAW